MKLFKVSIIFFGLLFLTGLGYTIFQSSEQSEEHSCVIAQKSLRLFETEMDRLATQEELWQQVSNNALTTDDLANLIAKEHSIFLYSSDSLVFWNNNSSIPEVALESISEAGNLVINKNGYYYGLKRDLGNFTLVGLQLIKQNYPIVNAYLNNEFSANYPFDEGSEIISADSSTCTLHNAIDQAIFSVVKAEEAKPKLSILGLIISVVSMICFWIVVWFLILFFNTYYKPWTSYLILFISSILFIELIEFVDFEFKNSILFSPELYASQYFGPSLGHLFINVFILFFINFLIGLQYYLKKWKVKTLGYLLLGLSLLFQIILYNSILQSLILDSIISFEINNFTLTTSYTLLGMLIVSILTPSLFINLYVWLHATLMKYKKSTYFILTAMFAIATFLLYILGYEWIAILVPVILFIHSLLFVFIYQATKYGNRLNHAINVLFFASLIIAGILSYYNVKNENFRKEIAANQLSENRDLITEYRFEEIQEEIKNDAFFRKFFVSPFVTQKELQQRLDFLYFGGYLSKYNVTSTAFNLDGKPIKTNTSTQLKYFYDIIDQQSEETYSEWLFLVPQSEGKSTYLSILPIENDGQVSGTLVLELSPKTYTKENLYPELLIEQKTSPIAQLKRTKDYEYGIYKSNYLVNQSGEYPFPYYLGSFDLKDEFPFVLNDESFSLTFFQIDEENTVVISDVRSSFMIPISTFSYVFCYLGLANFLLFLVLFFLNQKTNKLPVKPIRFTFQNKINLSIALITIASFIFIGIVTIGYFSELYKTNQTNILIKKQQAILSSLEYSIAREVDETKTSLPTNLSTELASLAEIQGIDINLFNLDGSLVLSSQPGVFSNGLVSKQVNPMALHHLLELREERYIQEENIGKLSFQSIYVPIRLKNGQALGILNLPYFAQEELLSKELSNLMVALVNVYVLLLIISIVVAFIISTSITRPLASISEKMGSIKVDSKNEEIEWESDDEIGALVKEYNKMIVQIEESANTLAQSERESAWREMARQIAHEIKNPLTPMKLSIQHLQRAIHNDPEEVKELASRVSKTMIEQIENLSEIATAFSSFAKMPTANKEKVNLVDIIQNVVNLFNQTSKSPIVISKEVDEAWVYADKNQLLSVFNNLVKNAQQATEDLNEPSVAVQIHTLDDSFLIKVLDNGVGISEDKINKVFVPNFTTKSSGTGLGLAISKQIIENGKGQIWFESKENKGTIFFVTLPKYQEQN